ncbi:MAG: YicC/YloC family endoribonuclease [Planctomycetota bacterium]
MAGKVKKAAGRTRGAKEFDAAGAASPCSMTGQGIAHRQNKQFSIDVELRSVNNRFLTIQVRVPNDFSASEAEIEDHVRKKLHRGSVAVNVNIKKLGAPGASAVVDVEQARAVAAGLRSLAKELKLEGKISIESVASAPGVLLTNRASAPPGDADRKLLLDALDEALEHLAAARAREGKSLTIDLRARSARLRSGASAIEERVPAAMAEYHQRLKKRVEDLLGEYKNILKDGDLARELALLAEKSDIAEEIARLRAHVDELDVLLTKCEPVGRRIDFLLQEMGREVNTTGSKSIDTEITRIVMDLKAELERIREQAANIE